MYLYTITTIQPGNSDKPEEKYGHRRTPGVCSSLKTAKLLVEKNAGDIFETTNELAVIEKIYVNCVYPIVEKGRTQWWYRWEGDYDTGKYVPCQTPEIYKRSIGFGIG